METRVWDSIFGKDIFASYGIVVSTKVFATKKTTTLSSIWFPREIIHKESKSSFTGDNGKGVGEKPMTSHNESFQHSRCNYFMISCDICPFAACRLCNNNQTRLCALWVQRVERHKVLWWNIAYAVHC